MPQTSLTQFLIYYPLDKVFELYESNEQTPESNYLITFLISAKSDNHRQKLKELLKDEKSISLLSMLLMYSVLDDELLDFIFQNSPNQLVSVLFNMSKTYQIELDLNKRLGIIESHRINKQLISSLSNVENLSDKLAADKLLNFLRKAIENLKDNIGYDIIRLLDHFDSDTIVNSINTLMNKFSNNDKRLILGKYSSLKDRFEEE